MKRIVKMDVAYLRSTIESLRMLNEWSEESVRVVCGRSKREAVANVIRGLETTVDRAAGAETLQQAQDRTSSGPTSAARVREEVKELFSN